MLPFQKGVFVAVAGPNLETRAEYRILRLVDESNEDAHIYFDEHLNEEEHLCVWRKVEVDPVSAMQVAKASLRSQHKVLDGVCEICGFCIACQ